MPGKRVPAERRIEKALEVLDAALAESHIKWMVIGGIAVIMRGVRRMTTDIDATIAGDAVTPAALVNVFALHEIVPRIPNAVSFARRNQVLLLRHAPSAVDLDVSFAWTPFEHEALEARTRARYGNTTVPTARAEDLVIYKALAARPKDSEDISALLALHPEIDLARVREHLAHLAELAEMPELVDKLERLIRTIPTSRPARSKPKSGAKPRGASSRGAPSAKNSTRPARPKTRPKR